MRRRGLLIFLFLSPAACALPDYGAEGQRCFENKTCLPGLVCVDGNVCAKPTPGDGGSVTDVEGARNWGSNTVICHMERAVGGGRLGVWV